MDINHSNKDSESTNSASSNNKSLLIALNEEMFRRLAPSVAVLVALMAVGVIGNILICYIFLRKLRSSSQNLLLLSLGMFDLLSSCVGVPSEIFDLRHYYLYESAQVCKAMRFLTTFPSLASILVLFVIAVDRYRKICKPLHPQIDLRQVRVAVIVIVAIALVLSIPAILIYGHRTFSTPVSGLNGYDCSVDDAYKSRPYPLVYEGIFLVAFFVFAFLLVCIYVRIWLETRRHIKYLKTHASFGTGMLDETTTTTSSGNYEDSFLENGTDHTIPSKPRKSSQRSVHKKKESSRSRRRVKCSSQREAKQAMPPEKRVSVSFSGGGVSMESGYDQGKHVTYKYIPHEKTEIRDNYDAYITSGHITKERVLENSTEAARTLLSSLPLNDEDVLEQRTILEDSAKASRTFSGSISLDIPDAESAGTGSARFVTRNELNDVNSSHRSPIMKDTSSGQESFTPESNKRNSQLDKMYPFTDGCDGDSKRWNRTSSRKLIKTYSHNGDLQLKAAGVPCQLQTSDSSHQNIDHQKIKNHCRYQNGCENTSSISEQEIKIGSNYHDTKLYDTVCSNLVEDTRQRVNKCPEYCVHQRKQFEPKEETSLLPEMSPKQSFTQSNQTSNFRQSEIRIETAAKQTDQSQRCSITSQARGSNYSKYNESVNPTKQAKKALRSTRMTVIAFAISAGFILSYLPHLTLMILRSLRTDFEHRLDNLSLIFYNIFLRSYFVNNVVNIFVYGTINLQFRTEVLDLWRRIKCAKS